MRESTETRGSEIHIREPMYTVNAGDEMYSLSDTRFKVRRVNYAPGTTRSDVHFQNTRKIHTILRTRSKVHGISDTRKNLHRKEIVCVPKESCM